LTHERISKACRMVDSAANACLSALQGCFF